MEESEHSKTTKKCKPQTRSFRGKNCNPHNYQYHYHHQLYHHHHHHHHSNTTRFNGFYYQNQYQNYPALLPLPQPIPFQLAPPPLFSQVQNFRTKPHLQKPLLNHSNGSNTNPPLATSSVNKASDLAITTGKVGIFNPFVYKVCSFFLF